MQSHATIFPKLVLFFLVYCVPCIPFGACKIRLVLDEDLENCGKEEWGFDLTQFQLIMVNDTTTIKNGTIRVTKDIKRPWKLHFYGEMYDRGQWQKRFERKFNDYCDFILRFGELWYDEMSRKLKGKGCPYPKEFAVTYKEEAVYYDLSMMPSNFQGRWRLTVDGDLGCMRAHFDFVDY